MGDGQLIQDVYRIIGLSLPAHQTDTVFAHDLEIYINAEFVNGITDLQKKLNLKQDLCMNKSAEENMSIYKLSYYKMP